jgi:AraC family transcriptional regulator
MIDAKIRDLAAQPTAAVRVTQPTRSLDLASQFDRYLPAVMERVQELGAQIGGPPYGRYHEFGPDQVDVEIGFPLGAPLDALAPLAEVESGTVGASALPAGAAAVTVHRGPYDKLPGVYDALHDWIHAQGRDEGAGPWESYVDDPSEVDIAETRTEVCWPVP